MNRLKLPGLQTAGFTLIEVMIAMVVTAIGLLGLAKMQALALSGSHNAGSRSLIALQVGSLVSAMHANPAYWAAGLAPAKFTATGTTASDAKLNTAQADCLTTCTATKMAAYDFQTWMTGMNDQFPTYLAKIDCTTASPITCEIYVTWDEKQLAVGKSSQGAHASETQSFSVFVKP